MESGALQSEIQPLVEVLKPRLKALVICLSNSWGGLEQVAAQDAVDFADLGLEIRMLCLEGSPIFVSIQERVQAGAQIKIETIDYRPRDFMDFRLMKVLRRLYREGVNLVHLHQPSLLGSVVPSLRSFSNVSLFASRHIMNNHNKKTLFHRLIYRRVDALIVMSQTLRRNILETHPLHHRQIKVVNLGLDFEKFDPHSVDPTEQRAAWGADEETIVIGLVGRIDPAKGQATFLRAAAGLLKDEQSKKIKLKFVIVGEETLGASANHLEELKEMIGQFRIEDQVVFAGFQQDIPSVMKAFDILVMPSRQEAFGLVAIEAMAMECPIIISRGGSAREIVGNEEYGLLMRPDDAFDLQRQLRFLIDRPELRAEMGIRARWHVRAQYDHSMRLKRTLELYQDTLARRLKY